MEIHNFVDRQMSFLLVLPQSHRPISLELCCVYADSHQEIGLRYDPVGIVQENQQKVQHGI